jgi:hypothetical protein
MSVPARDPNDYLGRYYLEITNGGCPAGGATYRIEPEPAGEWANPPKPSSAALPTGPGKGTAGGPVSGGFSFSASFKAGATSWSFFAANGSATVTASVQNTTRSQSNCVINVALMKGDGSTVGTGSVGTDSGLEFSVSTAGDYFLKLSVPLGCSARGATAGVSLTPAGGVRGTSLVLSRTTLRDGTHGQPYSDTIAVTGGKPPYHFAAKTALPPGLKLDTTTGKVFGTPTRAGVYSFVVKISDSSSPAAQALTASFSITIH